ncbi:MAG: aldehyde ferredoxin oxidoreductase family protein [Anaerolineaceae bacterium]|nr:aldehyde ferredoxin oxidoreductase family protein [Anaerolineaceae bacterium]
MKTIPAHETLKRVLIIDLSKRRYWKEERPEIFNEGMGGSGAAIRLLEEHCPQGADALGPDNPIIFAVGPLVGYYPLASKAVAMFKSPHTGNLGESHAGGRSAVSIRMAGYGAIVIKGKSDLPIYLVIDGEDVYFRDASALWGMESSFTVGSVLRKMDGTSGNRTIMRIGKAGEKQVTYAGVITETYRHFGRLGLGAVFGSKLLKAVVVSGKRTLEVPDRKLYRNTYNEIFNQATESSLMKKYHELGTAVNVEPLNAIGGLPTRNLQSGRFEKADMISGEYLAENYLGRRVSCAHCPVACIHLASLRIPYPHDPYFYKTINVGYDHELIFAVGSMLGMQDAPGMLQIMDMVEVMGLDVMSAGVTLAWATEALEKGLISEVETDGLALSWGNTAAYLQAVKKIVNQPNDFYKALARGVEHAASIYGGLDFALSFGKNEMPGYHTGPACHLGYLTGARHSHLDSGGYGLDQTAAKKGLTQEAQEVARQLYSEESWRQVLTSLTICMFARNIYTAEVAEGALHATGFGWIQADLERMGAETLRLKHAFKQREGFTFEDLRIPRRIYETAAPAGEFDEAFMREAIKGYATLLGNK